MKKPYMLNALKDIHHTVTVNGVKIPKSQVDIQWQLDNNAYNASNHYCKIEYGTSPNNMTSVITNLPQKSSDHLYYVRLNNLNNGQKYYYRVSYLTTSGSVPIHTQSSFYAAPSILAQNTKFYAYGDTRANSNGGQILHHNEVCGQILSEISTDPNSQTMLLHLGDWNVADGEVNWNGEYFRSTDLNATELRSKVALMGVKGNHEALGNKYRKYFPFPNKTTLITGSQWSYSYDYGPVHFIVLYVNDNGYELSQTEKDWIDYDLSNTDKKWKVIMFHANTKTLRGGLAGTGTIATIKQKAKQYGVQAVLMGHEHYYSHWVEDGTHYMILGGGGAFIEGVDNNLIQSSNEVYAATVPHFAKFDVQGDIMKVDIIQGKNYSGYNAGRRIEKFSIPVSTEISSTYNFNNPVDYPIVSDIINIKQGGVLTVNSTINMTKAGQITVETGGKLIVDGSNALMSNISRGQENLSFFNAPNGNYTENDALWNGILVKGTNAYLQTDETKQGVLEMRNNASIKNAEVGISVSNYFISNSTSALSYVGGGGIIRINGAHFLNNQKDIVMQPYLLGSITTGKAIPQESYIRLSDFKNDVNMMHDNVLNRGKMGNIYTYGINGLVIEGNIFENLDNTLSAYDKGTAITAVNSSISVIPYCNPNITPCADYAQNQFKNLRYGVKVINGMNTWNNTVKINDNIFDDTYRSIFLSGTIDAQVQLNNIKAANIAVIPSGQLSPGQPYGIYIKGGTGFSIEENNIWRPSSHGPALFNDARGIIAENTGENANQIRKNTFTNLFLGVQSQYENSGLNSSFEDVGLVLLCNNSQTSFYDFVAMGKAAAANQNPAPNYARIGYALNQQLREIDPNTGAIVDYPAGNDFSTVSGRTGDYQFSNNDANHLIYHYDGTINASANAEPTLISKVTPSALYITNPCSSNIGGNGGDPIGVLYINLSNAQIALNSSKVILNIWENGGNANLEQEVKTTQPWDVYQQFNSLIAESPYLSDEVLLEAIDNPAFTSLMIKLIMVANPQSSRSDEIMQALKDRIPAMPQSYIDEIKAGESTISQLEILKGNVAADNHLVRMIGEDIKRNYRNDDVNNWAKDSLIAFVSRQNNLVDKFELASIYLSVGQYTNMETVLTEISNMELSDANSSDYTKFALMLNTIKTAKEDDKTSNFLSKTEIKNMESILTSKRHLVSSLALAILQQNNPNYQFMEEVLDMQESSARLAQQSKEEAKAEPSNDYRIFPNPSHDYITLEYNPQSEGEIFYRISNSDGKIVKQNTLEKFDKKSKTEVLIDLHELSAGIYYFNIINNKQSLQTQKLVILK